MGVAATMVRRSGFQLEFGGKTGRTWGDWPWCEGWGEFFLEETEKTVPMRTRADLMETTRIVSGHATVRGAGYPV